MRAVVLLVARLLFTGLCDAAQDGACTLCAGGMESTDTSTANVVLFEDSEGTVTCGNLEETLTVDLTEEDDLCAGYQELTALKCACPERPGGISCNLCLDGSLPANPDAIVFDFEAEDNQSTCSAFLVGAVEIEDNLACQQIQDVGFSNCGCPITDEIATGCTMCDGDDLPNPDSEIIPFTTCGGIDRFMGTLDGASCTAYQDVFAPFCGCPGADIATEEGVCRFCGEGNFVVNPAAPADFSIIGVPEVPCAFAETIAAEDPVTPCNVYQVSYSDVCCSASPTPSAPTTPSPTTLASGTPAPMPSTEAPATSSANLATALHLSSTLILAACFITNEWF